MEEEEEEEEEEERKKKRSVQSSTSTSMVRRGLDLGKKAAVAGAAIASAPVVLPPLLLLSAVGAAFAFPFGVYLASYACTNKLMSSLLPPREQEEACRRELDTWPPTLEAEITTTTTTMVRKEEEEAESPMSSLPPPKKIRRQEEQEEDVLTDNSTVDATEERARGGGGREIEMRPPTARERVAIGGLGDRKEEVDVEENVQRQVVEAEEEERIGVANEIEMWPPPPAAAEPETLPQAVDGVVVVEEEAEAGMLPPRVDGGLVEGAEAEMWPTDMALPPPPPPPRVEEEAMEEELVDEHGKVQLIEGVKSSEEEEAERAMEKDGGDQYYRRATDQPMEEEQEAATTPSPRSGGRGVTPTLVSVECSTTVIGGTSVAMAPLGGASEMESSTLASVSIDDRSPDSSDVAGVESGPVSIAVETAAVVHSDDEKDIYVEYDRAIEQSALGQNGDGGRVEAVILAERAVVREESVMGAAGKEEEEGGGNAAAAASSSTGLTTIYDHSFVALPFPGFASEMEEPSSLSSEYASATEDRVSGATDVESGRIDVVPGTEAMVYSDNEGFNREQMIWEQIDALRTIVGYKASLQSTLGEELKALYLFTGVEPPDSLEEASDILEVGDKLRFLKAVVGVK